jgi:hypothetical protein
MATGNRRQTFEKMNRERRVREKRALKAAKREQRKVDASALAQDGSAIAGDAVDNEASHPSIPSSER